MPKDDIIERAERRLQNISQKDNAGSLFIRWITETLATDEDGDHAYKFLENPGQYVDAYFYVIDKVCNKYGLNEFPKTNGAKQEHTFKGMQNEILKTGISSFNDEGIPMIKELDDPPTHDKSKLRDIDQKQKDKVSSDQRDTSSSTKKNDETTDDGEEVEQQSQKKKTTQKKTAATNKGSK